MSASEGSQDLSRLEDLGRALMAESDLDQLLHRVLEEASAITGAAFAALGVLDPERIELERFIAHGVGEATHRAIGALPRGRGVLGVLIGDPRPVRLADVRQHPLSYGFPGGHPPMRSFLGVPIVIEGQAWGNLYLAEKHGGAFTGEDEKAATILAQWAALALDRARRGGAGGPP
jgi:GAF domain-containing protein